MVVKKSHLGAPAEITALVQAAKSGDTAAFAELVRLTYVEIYALAARMTNDQSAACRVSKDAYVQTLHSLADFHEEAQFTTLLYRSTAKCAAEHATSGDRVAQPADQGIATSAAELNQGLVDISQQRLAKSIANLPSGLRHVVVLHDMYGLSLKAIAAELNTSVGNCEIRLHRARRTLHHDSFVQLDSFVEGESEPDVETEPERDRKLVRSLRNLRSSVFKPPAGLFDGILIQLETRPSPDLPSTAGWPQWRQHLAWPASAVAAATASGVVVVSFGAAIAHSRLRRRSVT